MPGTWARNAHGSSVRHTQWAYGTRCDGSRWNLHNTKAEGSAQLDEMQKMVHLGPTGSPGQAGSVRRAAGEHARHARTCRRKTARSSERACGAALGLASPNKAEASIPAHAWTISAPKRSHPAKTNTQTAVSAQAAQPRHATTRHDTEHMAQICGSGARTLQKSMENVSEL